MKTDSDSNPIYCRLCLHENENTQNYIDMTANEQQIHDKIFQIFHFEMDEAEFSPFICLICRERVESIANFMETVLKNQETLKSTKLPKNSLVKQETDEMDLDFFEAIEDSKNFQVDQNDIKLEGSEEGSKVRTLSPVAKRKSHKKNLVREEFSCDICSKSLKTKTMLVAHMKKHLGEPSFECDLCDRRFRTSNGLLSHKSQGHDIAVDISKYLFCELCEGKPMFGSFNKMHQHYQTKHDTRGYVKCCSKKFLTKRSVIYHKEVHLRPTDFM